MLRSYFAQIYGGESQGGGRDRVLKERGQDESTWDLMYMRKTKTEQGRAGTTSVRRAYGARHGEPLIML